jgi:heme a synthase
MNNDRRLVTLRRLAWACAVLMLVVTSASAWLRLAQPRPACVDWPGCRSADRPATLGPVVAPSLLGAPGVLALVRGTHRVAATAVLLVVVALAALALLRQPRLLAAGHQAGVLLALALGLSVLGIVTPGSRSAAVLMLALSWRLLRDLHGVPRSGPLLARWALAGAVLWALQAALGALSGSRHSAEAPVAHMGLALLAGSCAFGVGWLARRDGLRAEGTALLALVGLQFALAAGAAGMAAAPAAVLLHNVGAALGLALLLGLARPAAAVTPRAGS